MGCEFESHHSPLTVHVYTGSNHARSTNVALDNAGTGLKKYVSHDNYLYRMCVFFYTTSTNKYIIL